MTSQRSNFAYVLLSTTALLAAPAFAQDASPATQETQLAQGQVAAQSAAIDEITVSARRRVENVQDVPIPISVVGGDFAADAGAFNVNRLKELVPTLQFYSSNPRNSAINIRGLGAPFGLTNDGIEPGVSLYVDGVFFARPASATLDFLDIQQVEVLRGPQGTLYGKNTTSGAINITTRKPLFEPETNVELSYGNYGFVQAKASVTGPLSERVAARLSFSGTQRDGFLYNVATQDDVNDLNNIGFKGQVLFAASDDLEITVAGDFTRQRPEGYAQVVAGVAPTLRAANRQWAGIIADLNYAPPSYNAFDRLIDTDSPWRSNQELGGASFTVNWNVGAGTLTAITAWRFWNWNPSNDRDFIGLPITTISAAPSKQRQWTQEIRYAGEISSSLNFVVGAFGFSQHLYSDPVHVQEHSAAAARFLVNPSQAGITTPGLVDNYGQRVNIDLDNDSAALFGQIEWAVTDRLRVLPGLRLNYDKKEALYAGQLYGGLQTTDPVLIAAQRAVLGAPRNYTADVSDTNLSGQVTVSYAFTDAVNAFATYSTSFKSVGLDLSGGGADPVKPEDVRHIELGLKTQPLPGVTANFTVFDTELKDFQLQVVDGVSTRGVLGSAEKARVRGAEFEGSARLSDSFSLYGAAAYTDGKYVSFPNAPPPLEQTGGPALIDVSGTRLPGISKWAASLGGEYAVPADFLGRDGEFFAALDFSARSSFSSNPTASQYLVVEGYGLLNGRVGFRATDNWDVIIWGRNLADKNYFELLSAAPGNSGLYVGLPGDPRTFGVTLRGTF